MHPIVAALIAASVWMTFTTVQFYRRGDVPRAVFWLVAIIALAQVVSLVR
jgi:hypothetical protein